MTFAFHKGKHRAKPLYWLRWWPLLIRPRKIGRQVMFFFDSKYDLPDGDQEDHNKLFGVAFGGVHKHSARFGWRYSPDKKKFILSAYVYTNGNRIMEDLCVCVANHWYQCDIHLDGPEYLFTVWNDKGSMLGSLIGGTHITKTGSRMFSFLLGPYFGGNRPAPQKLSINLKK